MLVPAHALEQVPHRGAAEALVLAARVLEGEVALGVQGLDEEVVGQHAVVAGRKPRDRQLPRRVDGVLIGGGEEEAVDVVEGTIEVARHHAVAGPEGGGQLALVAVLGLAAGEGHAGLGLARGHQLGRVLGFEGAAGEEEPQAVAQDVAAEGRLVGEVVLVLLIGGERGLAVPAVVGHTGAEGAGELVAARLGDHVDHAAGEAAVLGRHVGGHGRGLEDRVLDVHVERLAAQVLVEHDAVQGVEVLVGLGARDRGVAAGARRRGAGRQADRRLDGARDGQLLEQRLLHGLRALGAGGHRLELTGDHDLLLHRLGVHHRIQGPRLAGGDADVVLEGGEGRDLEGDLVVAAGQRLDDVVALRIGDGGLLALQRRRVRGHRHAGQRLTLVHHAAADLTGLRERGARHAHGEDRDASYNET